MRKSIIVRIILASLTLLLIICFFVTNKDPIDIIKNKLHIFLPSSSKVIKYDYNRVTGDFDAKILIKENDIEIIKDNLLVRFGQEYRDNKNYLPRFKNTVTWWDMDINNIESCYHGRVASKNYLFFPNHKTSEMWVFITKQNYGKKYLYIWYS